jgi:hypothetical protein
MSKKSMKIYYLPPPKQQDTSKMPARFSLKKQAKKTAYMLMSNTLKWPPELPTPQRY